MIDTTRRRSDSWGQLCTGAGILTILLLGYMLFWWNRGAQLNSNGLPTLAGLAILSGKIPYLDFHYWCPPGQLLIYTALTALFGDALIYVRAFALIERLATFFLLYLWLARTFSSTAAFVGTFSAAVGFSADVADVISHYDFDAIFASVAAGFTISLAMTSRNRYARAGYFLAGIFAGLCMISKQTQGLGILVVIPSVIWFGSSHHATSAKFQRVAEFFAGWFLPVGLVAAWLMRAGAWGAFVEQNFLKGSASKGPLWAILLRPLYLPFQVKTLAAAFLAALLMLAIHTALAHRERKFDNSMAPSSYVQWLGCIAALLAGFAAAWWLPSATQYFTAERLMICFSSSCIFLSLLGSAAIALRFTGKALRNTLDSRGLQIWILASISATTAYMFSLSWAAYEKMLLPGFAFLIALALDRGLPRCSGLRQRAILALCMVLIATATFRKLTWPYSWENWEDGPIRMQTVVTRFPELHDVRMTAESAVFLEQVTRIIDAHSTPDQTIFCFPNYALFYVLAHRQPGVFAYMHWFDIVSDSMVRQDEARIRAHPPAVILSVEMPETMMHNAETRFRNGRSSGQREMLALIKTLPGYRLIESVPIPYQNYPLNIYAR
jgi:hypothetical protein